MNDPFEIDLDRVHKFIARMQSESLARGIPICFEENGMLYEKHADGRLVELGRPRFAPRRKPDHRAAAE
jgi:hypothetical protein